MAPDGSQSNLFNSQTYLSELFRSCIRTKEDLTEEQREAVEFISINPASALYCDVGFGKTVVTLTALARLINDGYTGKILIVAPIRVCRTVWPQEPRLWTHLAWMRMTLLRVEDSDPRLLALPRAARTAEKTRLRQVLLDSPDQIHVINQEAVGWLVDECAARRQWPYTVVVFDESSRLRDHNSVVFKSLKRVRPYIERFHQLTATPASQTYLHLFAQIWLLDKGARFGNGVTAFRERYFNYNPWTRAWKIREGADREIERLIADICLVKRRTKDSVIRQRRIELPADLLARYEEFQRECFLELGDAEIDGVNAAVLCAKLMQFASGFVYDGNGTAHPVHNEKIEELRSLLDETLDEPVMVAYWFRETAARLRKAFPFAVTMDREGTLTESWNRREHKMMLVHPQSVSHGLNLQQGGHHLVIFDGFWSAELMYQLVGRLDRPGQTETVRVHLMTVAETMDEVVFGKHQYLGDAQTAMMARLRQLKSALA